MIILAIETSCDDTCIAILKSQSPNPKFQLKGLSFEILSNIVSSQVKLHARYGGVWPYLAKREHQKNLPVVFKKTLKGLQPSHRPPAKGGPLAKLLLGKIDLISVTVGPGLEPCLWVGVNFAKELAKKLKVPIIPVNHIEAHIFANWIQPIRLKSKTAFPFMEARGKKRTKFSSPIKNRAFIYGSEGEEENKLLFDHQKLKIIFPAICLVVSGGHTQLILMTNIGKYKILGETRDDAAGECFDKVARILGLGYPGGPAIERQAATLNLKPLTLNLRLPRPMIHQKNYDFSFSGLKTAVLYEVKGERFKVKDKRYIQEMCFEVQQAIIDVLIQKTLKAAKEYKAKSIILGGGVTANNELRKQFQKKCSSPGDEHLLLVPAKKYCTDNAVMVGVSAYFHFLKGEKSDFEKIKANANLRLGKNYGTSENL